VFVALGIHHAMNMCHIVNCCLPGCATFFYYLENGAIFKKKVIDYKMRVFDFLYNFRPKHFSFQEKLSEV
jgi:hypothetical protein